MNEHRQKILQLAEETNTQLKKNVYMNYMQFIETAKEISCKNNNNIFLIKSENLHPLFFFMYSLLY